MTFVTGTMQIERENGYKYLFYKKDGDTNVERIEFNDEIYKNSTISPGKYYYYQSNDEIVNASLLNSNYVYVVNGGFDISDIPYFADIMIEVIIGENRMLRILQAAMENNKEMLGEMTEEEEQAYESIHAEYEEKKDQGYVWDVSYDC